MVKAELEAVIQFDRERPDVYGNAHPKNLLRAIQEDGDHLGKITNRHIYSADQFDQESLLQLFRLAAKYEANPDRFSTSLQGQILISAFYEPSTRTRLSFESAWHRLGGDIMSITDRSTTGLAKGESLADVGEMFNNYGDCVVLRDTNAGSVRDMMNALRIPIINAGNGTDEHPTQALADLYTILKWRPALIEGDEKANLCIIGLPSKMRTVRSLLKLIALFPECFSQVTIVNDKSREEMFDPGQLEQLLEAGVNIHTSGNLNEVLPDADVVYINAIAWEGNSFSQYGNQYHIDSTSPLKEDAIILHPLARGAELCCSLDNTPHNWYFAQARGAVFLRQALLTCLVRRVERVLDIV
ncbi:aspartate/ornithine carbamoyltransferase family protein [Alteromonas halophila]|uniref:Aspartate carbamoyltransferase n=1 Tax=Alteromonas halophila TaxID=516698 RepID=A0A918JNB6_9ALTE|nr:aspartate carbamoyltransferase [Alteromonas halophila]GGW88614.1 aspartate carbamoyltransferase [Alteromonas halophila]